MRGYTENAIVSARVVHLYRTAEQMVQAIPDMPELRCHEVARAVGNLLNLEVFDGWYGAVDHSWLIVPEGSRSFILDVYSVGRLPPVQLLDTNILLGHSPLFRVSATRRSTRIPRITLSKFLSLRTHEAVMVQDPEWAHLHRDDIRMDVVTYLKSILIDAGFEEKWGESLVVRALKVRHALKTLEGDLWKNPD